MDQLGGETQDQLDHLVGIRQRRNLFGTKTNSIFYRQLENQRPETIGNKNAGTDQKIQWNEISVTQTYVVQIIYNNRKITKAILRN